MGVGRTRVRYDEDPRRADDLRLRAERRRAAAASECQGEKWPVGGEPVEARDAGRGAPKFLKKARRPFFEVARVELRGIARDTLDDVGEADSEAQ